MDAGNPLEDVVVLQRVRPGILLFDSLNPAADLENLVRTRRVLPDVKSLLLTARVDDELEFRAIKAGAQGCISREADPEALTKALETLSRGDFWVSHRMASRIIGEFVRTRERADRAPDRNELSRREWQILGLVAQGLRNKHIAHQLFVSESTVKTHLYSIFRKLEIGSRLEATLYYYQRLKSGAGDASAPPASGNIAG